MNNTTSTINTYEDSDYAYICSGLCEAALIRPRNCGNPRCNMVTKPLQKVPIIYKCPGAVPCCESPAPSICTTEGCGNFDKCKHAMAVVPCRMCIPKIDPPEISRTYSSVWKNNAIGTGHARSMLASPQGWSAKVNDVHQWMIIDAGAVIDSIDGLMLANRGDSYYYQVVTEIGVDYATIDNDDDIHQWNQVGTFNTGLVNGHGISWVKFSPPIQARLVRIRPLSWRNSISLRCSLILGGLAAAEHSKDCKVTDVKHRKVIDVNQLPAEVTLTSIPGGLPPAVNMEGGGYLGVIHSPKGNHTWAGRRMAWTVKNFNGMKNVEGNRVFSVRPGEECSISVAFKTKWRYNANDYCPGCVVQLYYGLCKVFCTGVIQHGIGSNEGNSKTTFVSPVDPGLYYITQSISLQYNFVDNISHHHNCPESAFAAIRVLPTTFEESIYTVLPQLSKDKIIALLCLHKRRGENSTVFSYLSRDVLYEIFSYLMG